MSTEVGARFRSQFGSMGLFTPLFITRLSTGVEPKTVYCNLQGTAALPTPSCTVLLTSSHRCFSCLFWLLDRERTLFWAAKKPGVSLSACLCSLNFNSTGFGRQRWSSFPSRVLFCCKRLGPNLDSTQCVAWSSIVQRGSVLIWNVLA
jgi:hypothetical protein